MGTLTFQGMMPDAGDGTCQVAETKSGGVVRCSQPAVATVTDSIRSYRVCFGHAKVMQGTGGSHSVKWD